MKKIIGLALLFITAVTIGQDILKLKEIKPHKEYDNILVKKIADDESQSSFIIWVKKEVRLHKHSEHSENLYVLSGKGEMIINDEKFVIQKGDYFNIPKGTPHALKVLSSSPVKVLSIQSPKFTGEDRIFLDK